MYDLYVNSLYVISFLNGLELIFVGIVVLLLLQQNKMVYITEI